MMKRLAIAVATVALAACGDTYNIYASDQDAQPTTDAGPNMDSQPSTMPDSPTGSDTPKPDSAPRDTSSPDTTTDAKVDKADKGNDLGVTDVGFDGMADKSTPLDTVAQDETSPPQDKTASLDESKPPQDTEPPVVEPGPHGPCVPAPTSTQQPVRCIELCQKVGLVCDAPMQCDSPIHTNPGTAFIYDDPACTNQVGFRIYSQCGTEHGAFTDDLWIKCCCASEDWSEK